MTDQSLLSFIKESRAQGVGDGNIRQQLIERGWKEADVSAGFQAIGHEPSGETLVILPKVADLLRSTIAIYRERSGMYLALAAMPVLIGVIFGALGVGATSFGTLNTAAAIIALLFVLAAIALAVVVVFWSQVALIIALRDRSQKKTIAVILREAKPLIWPYFVTVVTMGILTLGGFFFFVIPGLMLSLWFSLSLYALVTEGIRPGRDAVLRSRELIIGRSWIFLGRYAALGIILILVTWVVNIPLVIIGAMVGSSVAAIITAILSYAVSIILAPVSLIYGYLLFEAARRLPAVPGVMNRDDARKRIQWLVGGGVLLALIGVGFLIFAAT